MRAVERVALQVVGLAAAEEEGARVDEVVRDLRRDGVRGKGRGGRGCGRVRVSVGGRGRGRGRGRVRGRGRGTGMGTGRVRAGRWRPLARQRARRGHAIAPC